MSPIRDVASDMLPVTQVAKGIFKIGPLETGSGTPPTSPFFVVGSERAAIVEPGEGGQTAELLEGIRWIGVGRERIAYIIPTHIHLHHCHSINILLKEIPQAKVVVHRRGAPHLVDPTRLNASTLQVWGKDSGCPQLDPVPEDRVLAVAGGEVLDLGGRELEIIETLGHAPHHIAVFDRLTRALWPGDAAGAFHGGPGMERTRPDIIPPLFDVEASADGLHRLQALKPSVLFAFGYNGASYSPEKTLQWIEEDFRAVERICREGMKQKMSNQEITRRMYEYYDSVGVVYEYEDAAAGVGREMAGPVGMYNYLIKQDPSLKMPQ